MRVPFGIYVPLRLIFTIFTAVLLFALLSWPPLTAASECAKEYAKITKGRVISLTDFRERSEALNVELAQMITKGPYNKELDWDEILDSTSYLLFHAVQNTIQHGSRELEVENPNLARVRTSVITEVSRDDSFVYASISNPKIKSFPQTLLKEFLVGERVYVPEDERHGFKGFGSGHKEIFNDLQALPVGSSVKWEVDGRMVKFTLKLRAQ
jgi:hypothetical protein